MHCSGALKEDCLLIYYFDLEKSILKKNIAKPIQTPTATKQTKLHPNTNKKAQFPQGNV